MPKFRTLCAPARPTCCASLSRRPPRPPAAARFVSSPQGACLVKASPPSNLDASSENLFSSLVPESRWGAHSLCVCTHFICVRHMRTDCSLCVGMYAHACVLMCCTPLCCACSTKALSKYSDMVDSKLYLLSPHTRPHGHTSSHKRTQFLTAAPRRCPSTRTWWTLRCARRSTSWQAPQTRRASRCARCGARRARAARAHEAINEAPASPTPHMCTSARARFGIQLVFADCTETDSCTHTHAPTHPHTRLFAVERFTHTVKLIHPHSHRRPPQAELPELLEALDGSSPAAALPDALARELTDVAAMGGATHLRGVGAGLQQG